MKKILYILFAIIIASIIALIVWFDTLAKNVLESYAQESVGSSVTIGEFRSDWEQSQVNIDFIEVANPADFSNKNAFVLNHLSASLAEQKQDGLVILERLEFDGLLFTLEQNKSQVNLVELLKQLNQHVTNTQSSTSTYQPKNQNHPPPYRVKVKQLNFINTQLFIDTQWFKDTVIVPDVMIHNFGGEGGIPLAQVGAEIMKVALTRIQAEVEKKGLRLNEREIKESVNRQLQKKLNNLTDDLDDKAKNWLKKFGL